MLKYINWKMIILYLIPFTVGSVTARMDINILAIGVYVLGSIIYTILAVKWGYFNEN